MAPERGRPARLNPNRNFAFDAESVVSAYAGETPALRRHCLGN